jgi:hypothetical protein
MNRFHSILFMVILVFASSALAAGNNSFAVAILREGTYDVATVDGDGKYAIGWRDSTGGMYLHVEYGWFDTGYDSGRYLGLTIGKKLNSGKKENIWVLTDHTNMDSLQSELKKGNPLTLEKFTKLEFDSAHTQYFLYSTPEHRANIEVKIDSLPLYSIIPPEKYFIGDDYILYQKEDSLAVLCGLIGGDCLLDIACFYQNDGSFVFDSLPNTYLAGVGEGGCPTGGGSSMLPINRGLNEKNALNETLFRINGVATINKSSNIVIRKNKQPRLRLKGKR